MVQSLEDAISHSYTMQLNPEIPKEQADNLLNKHRSANTLGGSIKLTKKKELYPDNLHKELETLREERNWLVHKLVPYNLDDMYVESSKNELFIRIKNISNKSQTLQRAIEDDMVEFCEAKGKDMSMFRAEISKARTGTKASE